MGNQELQKWYYKMAYFFIANQIAFKRLGVVLLLMLNIAIWWPASVKLINYFASSQLHDRIISDMVRNQVNFQAYREKIKPRDLQIVSVDKIKIDKTKYDLVAKVYNPNLNWHAGEVDYSFIIDGYTQDWQTDFILPGEYKYLFKFSYTSNRAPAEVGLKINHVGWQRVKDKEKIKVLDNILIDSQNFDSHKDFSQVKFMADNQTSFGFWQVGWQVVLYQSKRPVAANYITTANFKAGGKKEISVSWPENLPYPSKIEIIPDLDVFDETNYILSGDVPAVNLIRGAKTEIGN